MFLKSLLLALVFCLPPACLAASGADARPASSADFDRAMAPIHTRAELDDYRVRNRAADPFAALSPAALERVLSSLQFGPKGLASLKVDDLAAELSAAQSYRLLALFGLQTALAGMPSLKVVSEDDRAVDTWRAGVTAPDMFILNAVCTGNSWLCMSVYGGICWMPCPLQ